MKLLWNPDQNADTVMRDFLEGYYGPAWEPIYEYITLLQRKVDKDNIHMHLYTNPAQGYLPDEVLKQADALFDEAESRVKQDDELLERVRVARMPLTYARVFPRNGYTIENGLMKFQGEIAKLPEVKEFVERLKSTGSTRFARWAVTRSSCICCPWPSGRPCRWSPSRMSGSAPTSCRSWAGASCALSIRSRANARPPGTRRAI